MADEPHPPGAGLVILRQAPAVALSFWLSTRGHHVDVGVGLGVYATQWMFLGPVMELTHNLHPVTVLAPIYPFTPPNLLVAF